MAEQPQPAPGAQPQAAPSAQPQAQAAQPQQQAQPSLDDSKKEKITTFVQEATTVSTNLTNFLNGLNQATANPQAINPQLVEQLLGQLETLKAGIKSLNGTLWKDGELKKIKKVIKKLA
jgi:hypothetical protein